MTMLYQEESYLTVDCPECHFNLLVVHNHDNDQLSQSGALQEVLDQDSPWD